MPFDLVIRGGVVVDGTGRAPFRADVGVRGERIAVVGVVDEKGQQELDAEGQVVTPGFIDGHTHMDAQVMWDPLGTCSCWHGVTTVVMGNCGFTLAPARSDQRDMVVRNLQRAEDISPLAMAAGIEWSWETFPDYLDAVERQPKGINYAANVGHSALRTWAMGERAFEETATEADLEVMRGHLRDSLRAGAIGFTTSRNRAHQTPDGRPVASRSATWSEMARLVMVMGEEGAGIFELAHDDAAASTDPTVRDAYYAKLRDLAVATGVPITFGTSANPRFRIQLGCIEATVAAGGRMFGQSHSRGVSGVQSFRTQMAFDRLQEWKPVRSLPFEQQRVALADPEIRRKLVWAAHHGDYGTIGGGEPREPDYDLLQVFNSPLPPHLSVREAAEARGVDPVELMIDLALETNFDQFFFQPFSHYSDDRLVEVMRHPLTVMTFSDSGAHVSQIMDSSIQTHLLGYWVRQRQVFTLEQAVSMMTSRAADAWGFVDHGRVSEGMVADLNVVDPETVGPAMPTVETDLPGGARRLKQTATGFRATIVGGQVVLLEGEHTGALPGSLVRGPLARHGAG